MKWMCWRCRIGTTSRLIPLLSEYLSLLIHYQFVLSYINKLPKESHDTDFSRIKSWYLDGQWDCLRYRIICVWLFVSAAYLRQSIILSAYETADTRALYNSFINVAGKIRTNRIYQPISVPEGIEQVRAFHLAVLVPLTRCRWPVLSPFWLSITTKRAGQAIPSFYYPAFACPSEIGGPKHEYCCVCAFFVRLY